MRKKIVKKNKKVTSKKVNRKLTKQKKKTKQPKTKPELEVSSRLTQEERINVIQWIVELKTNQRISELIKENFDKDISRIAVWKYRNSKRWKPLLTRLRKEFERNVAKIPIANKVDRLNYWQAILDESLNTGGDLAVAVRALKGAAAESGIGVANVNIENHKHFSNIEIGKIDKMEEKGLIDIVMGRGNDVAKFGKV